MTQHPVEIVPSVRVIYPWAAMEVGDRFVVPTKPWGSNVKAQRIICNAINKRKNRGLPEHYTTRAKTIGIVVTRVK